MKFKIFLESKDLSLDELAKHKVDKRFSGMVQHQFNRKFEAIKRFLKGEKPAVSVNWNGTEGNFTVHIMDDLDNSFLIEKKGVKLPAAGGKWMGFWDSDLKSLATEAEYKSASREQKMKWDAEIQLKKYVADQFYFEYADFWRAPEYEAWYWKKGKNLNWKASNDYWRKKIEG